MFLFLFFWQRLGDAVRASNDIRQYDMCAPDMGVIPTVLLSYTT